MPTTSVIPLKGMAAENIDSDQYVDGSIDLAHMSSQSVDEDNLHISNAGSNGQFLSKQSGDAGGLTWAAGGITGITDNATEMAITISSDEEVTIPKQPACLLYGADSTNLNITGTGTLATIVLAERFDQNNDFDGTSTFTAPVTGKYLVSVAGTLNGNTTASDYAYLYLVYSNGSIRYEQGNTNDLQVLGIAMSLTALIDMDAADTVQFAIKVAGDPSDAVDLQGHYLTENRSIMSITLLC